MKSKLNTKQIAFIVLYSLVLISFIVTLSFKLYYASLFIVIASIFNLFVYFSFDLIKEEDLKSVKKVVIISFVRLFSIIFASGIPCLLYYFVPFIKESVNVNFLFYSPILTLIEYIIIRVFYLIESKKNENTSNE